MTTGVHYLPNVASQITLVLEDGFINPFACQVTILVQATMQNPGGGSNLPRAAKVSSSFVVSGWFSGHVAAVLSVDALFRENWHGKDPENR
jgi:hypothetical protein